MKKTNILIDKKGNLLSWSRNIWIEVLRFLALTYIMYGHFANPLLVDYWFVPDDGRFGVIVFLFISGFYNCYSEKNRTFKFLIRSLCYMFWGFIICLILYYCHLDVPNPWEFLTGRFIATKYITWWFLYVYLAFTLFQPFINKFILKSKKWISLGIILVVFAIFITFDVVDPSQPFYFIYFSFNKLLLFFCIYSLAAWFSTNYKERINYSDATKWLWIALFVILFLGTYLINGPIIKPAMINNGFTVISINFVEKVLMALSSCSLVILFDNIPLVKNKPICKTALFLGQISLPIYLFHALTWTVMDIWYPIAPTTYVASYYIIKWLIYYVIPIAVSIVMYIIVKNQEKLFWKIYLNIKNKKNWQKKH